MTEWAVTSSVLILVVLALRQCLKGKISLRLQMDCGRWCWCGCSSPSAWATPR